MENEYPFYDSDNDNDEPFNYEKNGFIPLSIGDILKNISSVKKEPIRYSLFDNSYILQVINNIKVSDFSNKILMECHRNQQHKSENIKSIYDVYEYLRKTHFLNFITALTFGQGIWEQDGIDIQIQIVKNENAINYSKILIFIITSSAPENISANIAVDALQTKTTNCDFTIKGVPLISRIEKYKSYDKPIVGYDISLGFNLSSNINFENISMINFYNIILNKYIMDAIITFYPYIGLENLSEYSEKLINTHFEIEFDDKLISIKMICIPTMIYNAESNEFKKYRYISNDNHLIGSTNYYGNIDAKFINSASSSDVSQYIILGSTNLGVIPYCCTDYTSMKPNDILFTLNRSVLSKRYSESSNNLFKSITEIKSKDFNVSYWVPTSSIIIDNYQDSRVMIFGFINIYDVKGFDLSEIEDEICNIFDFQKSYIKNGIIKYSIVYQSSSTIRLILCASIKDSENHMKNKKKFKLFGGHHQ